jgi:hypothetical protein
MTEMTIYAGADGTITITGLCLQPSGAFVAGATITTALTATDGSAVTGWSALTFTDQGNGTYTAPFAASIVPACGLYTLKITATKSGAVLPMYKRVKVVPLYL